MTRRSAVALAGILLLLVALGQYEIRRPPDTSVSATPIAIPSIPTPRFASPQIVPSPATKPVVRKPVAKRPPVTKPWLLPALKQPVSRENQAVFEFKRGVSYSERKNWEVAIVHYTEAIRLKPDYVEAYENRGDIYIQNLEYDKAITDYAKAVDLRPAVIVKHKLSAVLRIRRNQAKAKADVAKAKPDVAKGKDTTVDKIVIAPAKTISAGSSPIHTIRVLDQNSILVLIQQVGDLDSATDEKTADDAKRPTKPSQLEWSKWDLRTGRQLQRVTKTLPFSSVRGIVSPDGSWVGVFNVFNDFKEPLPGDTHTGFVIIWDTNSGQEISRWAIKGGISPICPLAVAPSGTRIALATANGFLHFLAEEEGSATDDLDSLESPIQVWNVQEGRLEESLLRRRTIAVSSLAFDDTGTHLSALIGDLGETDNQPAYTGLVWRTLDWKEASRIRFSESFTLFPKIRHFGAKVVVLDGPWIFRSGKIVLWDTRSERITRTLARNEAPGLPAGFSPDGRRFAFRTIRSTTPGSGSLIGLFWGANPFGVKNVNEIAVLDIKSGAIVARLREPPFVPGTFAFTKDGRQIISGSSDGSIRIWKLPPPR